MARRFVLVVVRVVHLSEGCRLWQPIEDEDEDEDEHEATVVSSDAPAGHVPAER